MVRYQSSIIYYGLGENTAAITQGEQSLLIFRDLADQLGCAYALRHLGDIYQRMGQIEQSLMVWHEAQEIGHSLQHEALLESVATRLDAI